MRRRVRVRGRVQGVFFRESTRRVAEREQVAGWIVNRPDGTVEAVFEGEAPAVERLVAFCRRGPDQAQVEGVEESAETPEGLTSFEVG